MGSIWQDLRFSARTLLRSPSFTAIAVFTLMLGIGANSAIFTLLNAVLFRPLPYPHSERLMTLWNWTPDFGQMRLSEPEFLDFRNNLSLFESMGVVSVSDANLSGTDEPERVGRARLSASLFTAFGVRPVVGRTLLAEDDKVGAPSVVVLGYDLWRRRFGGSPDIVGKKILLNQESYTVIGVAPQGFQFPEKVEIWTPYVIDPANLSIRGQRSLQAIGKLKPGVTLAAAKAEAKSASRAITEIYPNYAKHQWEIQLIPLQEAQTAGVRRPLLILQGAVLLVLIMACANVASLLLARAQNRRGEMSLRLALGAGPWRLIRQFQFDGLLLSLAGGVLGIFLAKAGVKLLLAANPEQLPRSGDIGVDMGVVLWTVVISVVSGFLISLAAALPVMRIRLTEALADTGVRSSATAGARRFRNILVTCEVTLAVLLLIGGGLLLKNLRHLQSINPGFHPEGLLTVKLTLPDGAYKEGSPAVASFYNTLRERLRAIPQVESVGMVEHLPFGRSGLSGPFYPEPGSTWDKTLEEAPESNWNWVSPGYFETMKIPLLQGRFFDEHDRAEGERVVIIDEYLAKNVYKGLDPVGKRFRRPGTPGDPWFRIVGVAGYVKQEGLDAASRGQLYFAHEQEPVISEVAVLRTSAANPAALVSAVRDAVRSIDKNQPIYDVKLMTERVSSSLGEQRFAALLMGLFAALAVLLTAVGIYSVMAYSVSQRIHELGIRMALGAQPSQLQSMVVSQGMLFVIIGLAIGLFAAFAASRLIQGMLFEISVRDPAIFLAAPVLVALVGLLASYLPARRASAADPLRALRQA
jgi:putative ABC transport system permease protein